uniref:Reverse transcriptase domain-containing protein n=1 Tax=Nothobranchius rachovii TaxID=451742 RepID=A0A1A8RXB6_9TELE
MEELQTLSRTQPEYRQCSVMCFTETWLQDHIPDSSVSLPGFLTVRADRDLKRSGKRKGGGVAVLVNNRWCHPGHVSVKCRLCSPDVELLAVSCRPYYLPREFTSVVLATVYIPPSAIAENACDAISSVVAKLQTQHPNAFVAISGDFNHASLSATLPTFQQFVSCSTRENKTLDLCYANVKNAYMSKTRPPLGQSDHNLVFLCSEYKPLVQRQPVTRRTVRKWSQDAEEALQGCFETTDWMTLCQGYEEDINAMTGCVTDYINFCVDNIIPTRTVRCFANNKPWITSELKNLLNEKKRAFKEGDRELLRSIQKQLKIKIRDSKEAYRKKLENKLQRNNIRDVWSGMKKITGFKQRKDCTDGSLDTANELNKFFNRFSSGTNPASSSPVPSQSDIPSSSDPTFSCHTPALLSSNTVMDSSGSINLSSTKSGDAAAPFTSPSHLSVSRSQVKRQLERLNRNKAAGPDGVSPRVLKACAEQLCGILQHLFNLSLAQEKVPVLWKTSCLVPVPKKTRPSVNDDYRPVALTSHIMKVLERLLLVHLNKQTRTYQDPLQFAYRHGVGVEDAIIQLLQPIHCHLDKAGSTVRVMFFDFSSAFNTIQPDVLCQKLQKTQVGASTIAWIKDYLTNRPQFVRLKNCTSNQAISNIGAPQGTVLSPFLFTLYTSDFQYKSETCHLQKYSDDSAVVGCIRDGQEAEYRELVERFVACCGNNHLTLEFTWTREMVMDFRKKRMPSQPLQIRGKALDEVENYKYLGVLIDNRLGF